MAIPFNSISNTQRAPLVAAEFNSSQSQQGPSLLPYTGLIVGQKLAAGTAVADTIVDCAGVDQAIVLGGRGSMLHRQAIGWFASNKSTPLKLGVLADNGAGVAAQGTIVVNTAATADGTIMLYLGGVLVTVGVHSGDLTTAIATAIGAAINANLDLPVTATVAGSTVTILYRHKGLVGNSYDVRVNFYPGDALPAGVTLTITAVGTATPGTTNPSLSNLIAAMSDLWLQIWTHPYTDATTLTAIETDLASRVVPPRMTDAVAITAASGTFSALAALGAGRNSPSSCIFAQPGINPLTPVSEFAAETAALIAKYGQQDPARPFQTLQYTNAIAPAETDSFDASERNTLLFDGIATTKRGPGGVMQIDRAITTYQKSPAGAADTSYLDVMKPLTLMYLRYDWRNRIILKYPRHKLADDGTRFASGQLIMTPKLMKAESVMWFADMEKLGLVEGADQFQRDLVVERHAGDVNRLDLLLSPDLVDALIVVAASMQFLQ